MLTLFRLYADPARQRLVGPGSYDAIIWSSVVAGTKDPLGLLVQPACDHVVIPAEREGEYTLGAHMGGVCDDGLHAIRFGVAVNGSLIVSGTADASECDAVATVADLKAGDVVSLMYSVIGTETRRIKIGNKLYPVLWGCWHGTTWLGSDN